MVTCGADEAGRGCIAGSLFVAGVVLLRPLSGLADSKTLSRKKRFALRESIQQNARFVVVRFGSIDIDSLGLSACLARALRQICEELPAEQYLFDGNTNFGIRDFQPIIKGDSTIPAISAASILAKCAKDDEMLALHAQYPDYGFDKHCGYGTKAHIAAITKHGFLPIHRKSFHVKALQNTFVY
ncbi:MAG: ribonuclease HII [Helicobacter sp.]|nr:ribonuclease HII [Helicobacter sp.]